MPDAIRLANELSVADAQQWLSDIAAQPPYALLNPNAIAKVREGQIALYGAGNLGRLGADFLRHAGMTPSFVLDRNPNAMLDDIPVFTPDQKTPDDALLLIATVNTAYTPLADALKANGWTNILPFYDFAAALDAHHPLHNGWVAGTLSPEDVSHMQPVMEGWYDATSRAAFLQFIAWRVLREDWLFDDAPVNMQNRFFIPEVLEVLHADEVYVDGGAYDGCVLKALLEHVGSVNEAHLFEPDSDNRTMLDKTLSALDDEIRQHCKAYDQPLHDKDETVTFSTGFGLCSAIRGEGAETEAITLDRLKLKPSFIKLHLEGHELAVLKGAEQTLSTHRPLLAATIYHNRDGLWKTAHWLMQALKDYRFYFRVHSWCGTGAVIYAIPKERFA